MKTVSIFLFIFLLITGCQFSAGTFSKLDREAPKGLVELGGPVSGESCQYFFPLAGTPSIEKAIHQAIRMGPEGATGLKDVTIESYYEVPLARLCYRVFGTPVRE